MRASSLGQTQEPTLPAPRFLTALAVALSLLVAPAPPAAAHTTPELAAVPQALAARAPLPRADRWFERRTTPVQPVTEVTAVAVKPKVKKPAVKTAKPAVKKPAPKKTTTPKAETVTVTGRSAVAVRFALAQVGERYVWGASGPNTWDCSGLTAGAWAAAGVKLPHQSGAQAHAGRAISRSQLQPGDLVVWEGHVALSLGGNRILHAANSRIGVVIGTIYGSPIAYRRVG